MRDSIIIHRDDFSVTIAIVNNYADVKLISPSSFSKDTENNIIQLKSLEIAKDIRKNMKTGKGLHTRIDSELLLMESQEVKNQKLKVEKRLTSKNYCITRNRKI